MENFLIEYSKFLDDTNSHLSLQTLATHINLPNQLSDKEKLFISNHLAECSECSGSFDLIFDEDLELDRKKNVISLFRQFDNEEEDAVTFRSEDSLVEIELTKLSKTDFNLRFISLPSRLKGERAALKVSSKYILRVLAMDMETMFIIHSEDGILSLDSFELVSLTAPPVIPVIPKMEKPERERKFYWYIAAAAVIFVSIVFIYFVTKSGSKLQNPNEQPQVITDLTPNQKPIRESDTASTKHSQPTRENVPQNTQQSTAPDRDFFAANSYLENFINKSNTDSLVEIIAPATGADVHMPVTFEWTTSRKNITLKFVILSNQNIPVYNSLINGRELTIDTKLEPGLYYWKLESSAGTEAVGKFFIR